MKNPFVDFQSPSGQRRLHPAEAAHRRNEGVIRSWETDYRSLLADETDHLVWQVSADHLASVYHRMVAGMQGSPDYTGHDIEAFCARLGQAAPMPLDIPGPMGLFVSALVNCCRVPEIILTAVEMRGHLHWLGYRLPRGKTLTFNGDTGDFTGAGLCGGTLIVNGSAGRWCGAGMMEGSLRVDGNAGDQAGQWMQGGTLHVSGRIGSLGDMRYGGRITSGAGDDLRGPRL